MKSSSRASKESPFVDPDFAEAPHQSESTRKSQRQAERKANQFCRQVQRALNLALADHTDNSSLSDLFVEEVQPAPDCGHLLVYVLIPADRPPAEVITGLTLDLPRLRTEVAMVISRKRAPELCFVPVCANGGDHD